MTEDSEFIGIRIARERGRRSLTEAAFGELCGHKASDVKAWESGRSYPSASALRCLAEKGVDVFYVLTGRTGPRSHEQSALLRDFQGSRANDQDQLLARAAECAEEVRKSQIHLDLFNLEKTGK